MSDRIVLGSGKLYVVEYTGTIPADNTLETSTNLLGYIEGGATLEYTPEFTEITDDLGLVSKSVLTSEEVIFKSGVLTWDGTTLDKLVSTATVTSDTNTRTVKIGGAGNYDGKNYVIHFVHEDEADGDIRVTIVGHNTAGFEMQFQPDNATVINAEFKAKPQDSNGTLILFKEEV